MKMLKRKVKEAKTEEEVIVIDSDDEDVTVPKVRRKFFNQDNPKKKEENDIVIVESEGSNFNHSRKPKGKDVRSQCDQATRSEEIDISISNKSTEVKIIVSNSDMRRPTKRKTARKSISSFTPKICPVIEILSDDESPKEVEIPKCDVEDAFEQFHNQVCLALKSIGELDSLSKVQKKLLKYYDLMDESFKDSQSLLSFLLENTLQLSLDSTNVYVYLQKILCKLKSCSKKKDLKEIEIKPEAYADPNGPCQSSDLSKRTPIILSIKKKIPQNPLSSNPDILKSEFIQPASSTPEDDEDSHDSLIENTNKNENPKETTSKFNKSSQNSVPLYKASSAHINKLKSALRSCAKEIKRLETQEVDFDHEDEEVSSYILVSRYKERYMKLHNKLAQLENDSSTNKSRHIISFLNRRQDRKFNANVSRYPEINIKVAKLINKKRRTNDKFYFPDFMDILNLYETTNKTFHLGLNKETLYEEASDTFRQVGLKLKSRREYDDKMSMESYLSEDVPEPQISPEVLAKLDENAVRGHEAMNKVIQNFVLKQCESKEDGNDVSYIDSEESSEPE